MKHIVVLGVLLALVSVDADAATRGQAGTVSRGAAATASSGRTSSAAARSATTARAAAPAAPAVSARAATTGRTTVSRTSASTTSTPTVAARAASTQKVLNMGTSVAVANENIVVSDECRQKYYGCMDSFCMLDNDSGGRCICSDRNAELDEILDKIQLLDQQTYQMATYGVERIEMGADADAAIANANAVAQSIMNSAAQKQEEEKTSQRRSLDLSLWSSTSIFSDSSDVFGTEMVDPIEGKEGDALYTASHQICAQSIPECSGELNMLQLMYSQQIRSDCSAYENSLKQQQNASTQKLYAAEQALRGAALEQYRSANRYDLGQCTVEFKNCMITTGGCGEDFSGCASVVAFDATNTRSDNKNLGKTYSIKGAVTSIDIQESTYDILMSKKPLCESVTRQCTNVADQVWDTFLREVAPQVKAAELIAEDNARQNCIGNISSCFQQACRDSMDANNPESSYDMCLTRPETMLNVCRVPLNACGIDASSAEKAEESQIWDFVIARLQSMRVNSCTTQVRNCLQSEDRCGSDYTQCLGLDTDTIIRMCPEDLLIGCQGYNGAEEAAGEEAFYDALEPMIQGIMLNIDNNMLAECQKAADTAMISVCGDSENCNNLAVDENVGTHTLEYKLCKTGTSSCVTDVEQISNADLLNSAVSFEVVIDGEINWGNISFDNNGTVTLSGSNSAAVSSELQILQNNIQNAISTIEADPQVQFCVTGRSVQGVVERGSEVSRFENLTTQMREKIAASAIRKAMDNYYAKYAELEQQGMKDYVRIAERRAEAKKENAQAARLVAARTSCVGGGDTPTNTSVSSDALASSNVVVDDWNYRETVTSTFSEETLVCHRCTRTQNCLDPKGGRKMCKEWAEAVETCVDIQF